MRKGSTKERGKGQGRTLLSLCTSSAVYWLFAQWNQSLWFDVMMASGVDLVVDSAVILF